jgi:hypothetical protein
VVEKVDPRHFGAVGLRGGLGERRMQGQGKICKAAVCERETFATRVLERVDQGARRWRASRAEIATERDRARMSPNGKRQQKVAGCSASVRLRTVRYVLRMRTGTVQQARGVGFSFSTAFSMQRPRLVHAQ